MTIAELIEKLKGLDQTKLVIVRGYEDGLNDVSEVEESKVYLNYNTKVSYYGKHEYCDGRENPVDYETAEVVVLKGSNS